MGFIKNLQDSPESKKKIVFWVAMAVFISAFVVFQFFSTKNNIAKIGDVLKTANLPGISIPQQDFNLPGSDMINFTSSDSGEIFQEENRTR